MTIHVTTATALWYAAAGTYLTTDSLTVDQSCISSLKTHYSQSPAYHCDYSLTRIINHYIHSTSIGSDTKENVIIRHVCAAIGVH